MGRPPIRRVLLISAGTLWSAYDVLTGLHKGFRAIGVESHPFHLDVHIDDAMAWLAFQRARRGDPAERPHLEDLADACCLAGQQALVRALAEACDAAVVITGTYMDGRVPELFRRARVPTYLYATESPYDDDVLLAMAPSYAAVSTNDRASLPRFEEVLERRGAHTRLLHLPLGYDPARHYPGAGADRDVAAHDVVFVGNVFQSRDRLLRAVDWAGEGIDLGLYGDFRCMPADSPLWRYANGATPEQPQCIVDNRLTTALHTRAKIVLNLFREERFRGMDKPDTWQNPIVLHDPAHDVGPRLIECAASGAFVISQWRPALDAAPWAGLVPTFRTASEMLALVRRYLADDAERGRIASQLPGAVAGWSYHDRAETIAAVLAEVRSAMGRG